MNLFSAIKARPVRPVQLITKPQTERKAQGNKINPQIWSGQTEDIQVHIVFLFNTSILKKVTMKINNIIGLKLNQYFPILLE